MSRQSKRNARAIAQDVAAEVIRRACASRASAGGELAYVIHLIEPPAAEERLHLAACRLMQQPIVLVPGKCLTIEEWVQRYASQSSVRD